jgi:hypothetical protein
VASQRAKRRSRKPRGGGGKAPRAAPSRRRERRALRTVQRERADNAAGRTLGTHGERPQGPFGRLPVSELAILIGLGGVIAGYLTAHTPAMIAGGVICAAGVTEVTAREHFSGFRSHSTLLAALPAVLLEAILVAIFGEPQHRALILVPVLPVFALAFWLLRRSFARARHLRAARPPAP